MRWLLVDRSRAPLRAKAALTLGVLVLAILGSGCPCMHGAVNASPGLRWWLFANFGASKICPEMLKRGMGLHLQDRGPTVGRFFPAQCSVDVNGDRNTITVNFAGTGYAFTTLTRRVGFSTVASVEYRPDFYLGEQDIYVWGRVNRVINGPSFRLGYVENPVADVATAITPLGAVANLFGNQIVTGELTQGFTVVQSTSKGTDFTLGTLNPPLKPHHPFDVSHSEFFTFANEITEIRANQMDFLGPFEVVSNGQYLLMTSSLDGPALDIMIVDKITGDAWREAYQTGRPIAPPPGPILQGGVLNPGPSQLRYPLGPGRYYVVVDNSPYIGMVAPRGFVIPGLPEAVARLSYVAQLAE